MATESLVNNQCNICQETTKADGKWTKFPGKQLEKTKLPQNMRKSSNQSPIKVTTRISKINNKSEKMK